MAEASRTRRRIAAVAVAGVLALLGLEWLEEGTDLLELGGELLEIVLLVGTAAAVAYGLLRTSQDS